MDDVLYSVVFVLNVKGRGLTVHCSFPDPEKAVIRAGDPIEFIRPDKSVFRTRVTAIQMAHSPAGRPGLLGLVLPEGTDRDEIPYGSFVRLTGTALE